MPVFEGCGYLPLLSLKPAEMNAVQELAEMTKDAMLPHFFLKRWGASHNLVNSTQRISQAIDARRHVLELGVEQVSTGERRAVHDELDALRDSHDGYANWRGYIENLPNVIPGLQIDDLEEFAAQVSGFSDLGRGMVVRLPLQAFQFIGNIAAEIADNVDGDGDVCFILDFERQDRHLLNRQAEATGYINAVRAHLPGCHIAISATSFPDSFGNISSQDIFERLLFEGVRIASQDPKLIYSDRGSARAEALGGGGGEIPPRVDYAGSTGWSFFRADSAESKAAGYLAQAEAALASDSWDEDLHVWGTQLIERTAAGETNAIYSPATAAAARINIHLHRQQNFGSDDIYETEEDWQE